MSASIDTCYNDHHEAYKLKSVRIELGSTLCRVTTPTGKLERTNDIVPEIDLYAEGGLHILHFLIS